MLAPDAPQLDGELRGTGKAVMMHCGSSSCRASHGGSMQRFSMLAIRPPLASLQYQWALWRIDDAGTAVVIADVGAC